MGDDATRCVADSQRYGCSGGEEKTGEEGISIRHFLDLPALPLSFPDRPFFLSKASIL